MAKYFEKTKIFARIIFFGLGAIGIFFFCSKLLVLSWGMPDFIDGTGISMEQFEHGTEKDVDVIFLGTSHMQCSISPMQLYQQHGILSYNLATSDQPLEESEYLTKRLFDLGYAPRVIVLDVNSLFYCEVDDAAVHRISDNNNNNFDQLVTILHYYKNWDHNFDFWGGDYKKIFGYICPFFVYHDRWDELNYGDFYKKHQEKYFLQGFYGVPYTVAAHTTQEEIDAIADLYISNSSKDIKETIENVRNENISYGFEELSTYSVNIPLENQECLERISVLCHAHNCKLLLVKIPVMISSGEYYSSWTKARHDEINVIANRIGAPFLDWSYQEDKSLEIDWNHDTSDCGMHLNFLGAEKITSILGDYLVDTYLLPISKNDSYDKKLVLYEKYSTIAHIEQEYDLEKYIDYLTEASNGLVIILSAKDDMICGLNPHEKKQFVDMGLESDFDSMRYNYSFIAVLDDGTTLYECVSNKKQYYECKVNNNELMVISAGFLDGNTSSIKINKQEYSTNYRGINFVVIDKETNLIIDRACCDTYSLEHEVIHDNGTVLFDYQNALID